jgi:lipopolysaccharide/colanic/teichoic acid biosynthesis glycosyltransferase
MSFYRDYGKRWFDIIASLFGLIILFPIFLVVSILVSLNSPGSIFFCQDRIGRKGKEFRLIKFRTMSEDKHCQLLQFTPGEKTRVTAVGRLLRRTKIDELPTLINVLKGDMSLVGPRPEVPKYLTFYQGRNSEILNLRPGITDFASQKYRNEEELLVMSNLRSNLSPDKYYEEKILPDKLELNLKYLSNISFSTDLYIIFKTLTTVLFG